MTTPEVWLRGPLPDVAPVLQPVAHALRQAREEVDALVVGFPDARLWARPAGVASVGFHLRHLAGVLDRLTTYARGESLSPGQLAALAAEEEPDATRTAADLAAAFAAAVQRALAQLRATDPASVFEPRAVGRARLPSTVLGLLVHAAEHTMRHVGQLTVTARVVRAVNLPATAPAAPLDQPSTPIQSRELPV
ncbi:MAG TPA: DinB family protein [Gemmatirosa sp.]